MTWDHITLTIPVEHADAANDVMRIVDFDTGGADTFGRTGLSPDGTPPATHYVCETVMDKGLIGKLTRPSAKALNVLAQLALGRGRPDVTEGSAQDWLDHVQVTAAGVFPKGLRRVVEPTDAKE